MSLASTTSFTSIDTLTVMMQALSLGQTTPIIAPKPRPALLATRPSRSTAPKITHLVLDESCGKSPQELLQLLQRNPFLHTLKLKSLELDSKICAQISKMTTLNVVELDDCRGITELDLRTVVLSKSSFESLSICNSQLVNAVVIRSIWIGSSVLKKLKKVSFKNCPQLDSKAVKWLAKCLTLEEVILTGCKKLTDDDLLNLTQLRSLKLLDIHNCPLLSDQALQCILSNFQMLQKLYISFTWNLSHKLFMQLKSKPQLAVTVTPKSIRDKVLSDAVFNKPTLLEQLALPSLGKCTWVPLITFFPDPELQTIPEETKQHFPMPSDIKLDLLASDVEDYLADR